MRSKGTYVRCDSRALHLVQNIPYSSEVFDMCTIGIKHIASPVRAGRQWVDNELRNTARMNLEMELSSNRVLPQLHEVNER